MLAGEYMILVDTNCLLLLADLDDNNEIDKEKLESFVSKKDICISAVSIFELLNNPRTKGKYSFIVQMAILKSNKTHFMNTAFFDNYFNCCILNNLECKSVKEQEKVKNEMSKAIIDIFSYYYSNLLACAVSAYFIIFDSFCDGEMFENYFKKHIQINFDLLEAKLRAYLSIQFKMMVLNYCFNEKTRKRIIESLYFGLIKEYAKVYNKTYIDLDRKQYIAFDTLFSRLISVTRKIDVEKNCIYKEKIHFEDISLFESLTKEANNDDDKQRMKKRLTEVATTLAKNDHKISPYLNKLFESNLCSLLFEKAKFNDNDILDSLILDYIHFSNGKIPFDGLLTFDKKMASKAKAAYPGLRIYDASFFR